MEKIFLRELRGWLLLVVMLSGGFGGSFTAGAQNELEDLFVGLMGLSQSDNDSDADELEDGFMEIDGVWICKDENVYMAETGPMLFKIDYIEDKLNGKLQYFYDKGKFESGIVFTGDFGKQIAGLLEDYFSTYDGADYLMRFTLAGGETFVLPVYVYGSDDDIMFVFRLDKATYSSEVEEIGTDRFTGWSTMKYLGSRLLGADITTLELACVPKGEDVEQLFVADVEMTVMDVAKLLEAIAEAVGSRNFITDSWKVE